MLSILAGVFIVTLIMVPSALFVIAIDRLIDWIVLWLS
jgi:hypothetical protein